MMPRENAEAVKRIFGEALEKPTDQRAAYLDAACQGDGKLRAKVEALLAAYEDAGDFLSAPTHDGADLPAGLTPDRWAAETSESERPGEGPGTTIGRYKLLQRIGEGGFGVVYMAEQEEPVRRKVALKIIKLGMDTKQVIARFEAERQALAMMEHPNIARVLDAGATETGRPYFVMELVKGIPITEYCDRNNLSTKDRLDLFTPVCNAVQHAHQKGVIHRDIKPSNVMVTLHDGNPVPKVIDFGIAKATDHRLTEKTLFTEYRQLVGTPAYMSPEQAEMSGLDVDTRTDIYSLGVLLYELLTGTTPFDAEVLRQAAYGEIQRIIREVEPPKPSTRLSSLATEPGAQATGAAPSGSGSASLAEIAKHRRTDPSTLSRLVRGDLDWIVMKALEKDRTRRYETAKEFAKDVEHHLANEPILASPPGMAYRFRKFVKRNRVAVTAGSLVAAALVIGLIVSMVGFVQASRQRDRAIVAEQQQSRERQRAETARAAEAEQRTVAVLERDRATAAEQRAVREKQQARQQAYVANIQAANAALSENDIVSVRRLLDAAAPEFRNWEWEYLDAQTDDSLVVLRGHQGTVWAVAFSPDGTRLASGSGDKTVRLWDVATGKEVAVLHGHQDQVRYVVFSPDGKRLASGSAEDTTIRLWDTSTGQELAVLRGHDTWLYDLVFSSDGKRLASASYDKTVHLWDVSTGEELSVLQGHESPYIYDVAFSPDGSLLASASGDKTVRLWDTTTGTALTVLQGHKDEVNEVKFSPDGILLASASWDKTVRLWDAASGEELAVLVGHEHSVGCLAFGSDSKILASGSFDGTLRLWETSTGREVTVMRGHDDKVSWVAFSPDGKRLASVAYDNTLRLWDVVTGEELICLRGHAHGTGQEAVFSPDGRYLAAGSRDGVIRFWDAYATMKSVVLEHHDSPRVRSVAFSPDGTRLASASSDDKTVRLWDASTGEELAVLLGHEDEVVFVTFSPDGNRLASGSADSTIRLWDAFTGEELAVLTGHTSWVYSLAFSPDGARLASASSDTTIRLWDTSTGHTLNVLRGHGEHWYMDVAFSPDGTRLASASGDDTVRLWDASTGEQLTVLQGGGDGFFSVAFSPDGTHVAAAHLSDDFLVRIWETSTGKERTVLRGHTAPITTVVFGPDGTRLATSSRDGTLRLWNVRTGDALIVLRGHEDHARDIVFSPDGTRLASASYDGTVRIWHTEPYRVRYQRRQAILAARPEAEQVVNTLWQTPIDAKSIAGKLRENTSLSEPQRRAALNLLLNRSAQLQDHVNDLCARLVFTQDVVAALEDDDSLAPGARYKAVSFARRKGDRPLRLNKDSWNLIRSSGGDPQTYEIGLRGAEAAVAAEPGNLDFLSTLGLAQYRSGRYEEAYATLSRCDELRRQRGAKSVPCDVAVLGMALFKLGRGNESQAMLQRLEDILNDADDYLVRWWYHDAATALFEECKQLLEGSDAQAEPLGNAEGDE